MGSKIKSKEKKSHKSNKTHTAEKDASLSTFLLAQVDAKDSALDDIFANSKGPSLAFQPSQSVTLKKDHKRKSPLAPSTEPAPSNITESVANDADLSELDSNQELDLPSDIEEDTDEDDAGVEEAYAARQVAARLKALSEGTKSHSNLKKRKADDTQDENESGDESAPASEDEEEPLDVDNLVHSMVFPKSAVYKEVPLTAQDHKKAAQTKMKKLAHDNESPEDRNARTIFLANVPVICSTSRPQKKALLRHILLSPSLLGLLPPSCPTLKASSIRFRSLAFASTVFGRKADSSIPPSSASTEPPLEPGGRGRKRAREWRNNENTDERGVRGGFREKEVAAFAAVSSVKGHQGALTDGQKRRVAFIRGEINEGKKVCNAYLVLDPLPTTFAALSIADIIALIVADANGSIFDGYTLRADRIRPQSSAAVLAAAQMTAKPSKTSLTQPINITPVYQVPPAEARRTLFMGGLDFAESEENVRAATETILVKERGPSGEKGWVEGVRLIRDASTGLGKGFGYVLLRDTECVDELLALPFGQPLKVSKRKPRLERCKSGVAAARAKAASVAKISDAKLTPLRSQQSDATPPQPRKSLSTGKNSTVSDHQAKIAAALSKLPVEERKKIKAIDPDRVMRRAHKKKNKILSERYERKQANGSTPAGILGRESRGMERRRKEKKRVAAGNKTGKRAKF